VRTIIKNVLDKAKDSDTISLPLLLREDHDNEEVGMFWKILKQQIHNYSQKSDFYVRYIRLVLEDDADIECVKE
jgi:hypothetical protein